ncbi:MAG: hypothetical protein JWQ35_1152 [Bacteriovoracaceae bacterium]|nr:hypothetical protein [Bacteriovoracaceae bacterium]
MRLPHFIHSIRVWSPDSAKIKQRFFIRDEILFGTDKTADVYLKDLPGFFARVDFKAEEIHYLEEDRIEKIEAGEIFQIQSFVCQWKAFNLFSKKIRWASIVFLTGLLFIFLVHSLLLNSGSNKHIVCSRRLEKISSGAWGTSEGDAAEQMFFRNLGELKKSFQTSLKTKQWAKSRAELDSIESTLESERHAECGTLRPAQVLEAQFSRALIVDYLKDQNTLAAAEEIRRFRNRFQSDDLDRLENRVFKAAHKIYLEGYRLEEEDFEKGNELMEKAQQTCVLLDHDPMCFKVKKEVHEQPIERPSRERRVVGTKG